MFEIDEKLIELVRSHEELYNFDDRRYWDNVHKNKLWKEIGEQINKRADECKKRWESLRAQYRKICRSRNTKIGQPAEKFKRWKYEEEMSFILPYTKDKDRLTLVNMDLSSDDSESFTEAHNVENTPPNEVDNAQESVSILPLQVNTSNLKIVKKGQRRKATGKLTHQPSATSDETPEAGPKSDTKDALDHFFEGIKATVRTFSPMDQLTAKTRIFNIVSEIETEYVFQTDLHKPTNRASSAMSI
ncbi:uncharacterized protein [Euwallacea fornicatus]|uniref:uncharacterized protein n=1 Tax=Euwallacea fornicatus TaxID=995702 RepID=UPI00338E6A52